MCSGQAALDRVEASLECNEPAKILRPTLRDLPREALHPFVETLEGSARLPALHGDDANEASQEIGRLLETGLGVAELPLDDGEPAIGTRIPAREPDDLAFRHSSEE